MVRKHAIPPDEIARQEMLSRAGTGSDSDAENGSTDGRDSKYADAKDKPPILLKEGPSASQANG